MAVLDGEIIVSLSAGYDADGVYTDAFLARPAYAEGPRPGVVRPRIGQELIIGDTGCSR